MTAANPFELPGQWLKAQLHTHTTESDGDLAPEALLRHYAWAGYDVVALTDHWKVTRASTDEDLITILGAELNADIPDIERYSDVLVYGIEDRPDPSLVAVNPLIDAEDGTDTAYESFPTIQAAVDWATAQGGFAYLAHPYWSGVRNPEVLGVRGLAGIEVHNGTAVYESDRAESMQLWDEGLEDGLDWFGIATDDVHYPGFDLDRGWVWLRASERTPEAALTALREGAFYSSSGPRIDEVIVDASSVIVRCSPCVGVTLHADRERGSGVWTVPTAGRLFGEPLETTEDGSLTMVRLQLQDEMAWGRVVVRDAAGRGAWTNPLPIR